MRGLWREDPGCRASPLREGLLLYLLTCGTQQLLLHPVDTDERRKLHQLEVFIYAELWQNHPHNPLCSSELKAANDDGRAPKQPQSKQPQSRVSDQLASCETSLQVTWTLAELNWLVRAPRAQISCLKVSGLNEMTSGSQLSACVVLRGLFGSLPNSGTCR